MQLPIFSCCWYFLTVMDSSTIRATGTINNDNVLNISEMYNSLHGW